jgi:metallophosphoesterase (TIGR00282 family)
MNILYIGDIMGEPGVRTVEKVLPGLRRHADLVIAQAENVSEGKGVTPEDFKRLRNIGVDFFTGGNWSLHKEDIVPAMSDPAQPIIRPANYPDDTPGLGYKYVDGVLVVSLLGQIVGKDSGKPLDNPLQIIDHILEVEKDTPKRATVVNFHGDYSSEKVVIGHYLDGRVSVVVGDHWHVPTADARVLPGGTAHVTDVGMCGALDASLGVMYQSVVPRWRDGKVTRNVLETAGKRQFNAVLVKVNEQGLADSIERIERIF